jgi:hypothetical protein
MAFCTIPPITSLSFYINFPWFPSIHKDFPQFCHSWNSLEFSQSFPMIFYHFTMGFVKFLVFPWVSRGIFPFRPPRPGAAPFALEPMLELCGSCPAATPSMAPALRRSAFLNSAGYRVYHGYTDVYRSLIYSHL